MKEKLQIRRQRQLVAVDGRAETGEKGEEMYVIEEKSFGVGSFGRLYVKACLGVSNV